MTDARFPDRWLLDRRFMTLSPDAFRTYVVALVWSVSNRTDGAVDSEALCLIPGGVSDTAAGVLVRKGLWRSTGDGFEIVDFQTTQTSAAQLAAYEVKAADDRDRKSRSRARQKLRSEGVSPDGHGTKGRDVQAPTQDRTDKAKTGQEEEAEVNLHEERYSGSDAEPMSAPYLSRLDEEDEDWERTWGPREAS